MAGGGSAIVRPAKTGKRGGLTNDRSVSRMLQDPEDGPQSNRKRITRMSASGNRTSPGQSRAATAHQQQHSATTVLTRPRLSPTGP